VQRIIANLLDDQTVSLPEEESHHLVRVLRTKPGERFLAHDGRGAVYLCALAKGPDGWIGQIVDRLAPETESSLHICLVQSLIKKDKFEWVVQKAVELGVQEIVPLITWRTEVRPDEEGRERKLKRWEKIALEAFKQSARTRLPEIHEPKTLASFLEEPAADLRFALDEGEGMDLRNLLKGLQVRSCQLLVGPEGGWDERDRAVLREHEVTAVNLGRRILRAETCPIAIISILQYELGDLGPARR
jgi:16S rRNA (uracil1498-N3)-methyltransferase